ncbi:MAG TPA: hypothetical protein PKW95_15945 [bacterium]|nr:hypothetical protein [bacterium]
MRQISLARALNIPQRFAEEIYQDLVKDNSGVEREIWRSFSRMKLQREIYLRQYSGPRGGYDKWIGLMLEETVRDLIEKFITGEAVPRGNWDPDEWERRLRQEAEWRHS